MVNLDNVTLVCVNGNSDYKFKECILSLKHCMKFFNFGEVKLITNENVKLSGINVEKCPRLDYKGYSKFMIYYLYKYINTDFVLFIQSSIFLTSPITSGPIPSPGKSKIFLFLTLIIKDPWF